MGREDSGDAGSADFADMIRKLNVAISRLPSHEMRVEANGMLLKRVLEIIDVVNMDGVDVGGEGEMDEEYEAERDGRVKERSESLQVTNKHLRARVKAIQAKQKGLLLEISRESKIASSQLQIVSPPISQVRAPVSFLMEQHYRSIT